VPYQYDIFISYKRGQETNRWIIEHFEPLLAHVVELELGRSPIIYRDNRLHDGGTWPIDLGIALGSSRVLVPLWTKTYFHSEWCVRELSIMLDREREMGCRTPTKPDGMIIPAVLHDCEIIKPELAHVEYRQIRDCYNVRMRHDSARAERLADELGAAAPGIARSIESVPEWQPHWPNTTAEIFLQAIFSGEQPQQNTVPRFSS